MNEVSGPDIVPHDFNGLTQGQERSPDQTNGNHQPP